jgi:putative phosphoesterase
MQRVTGAKTDTTAALIQRCVVIGDVHADDHALELALNTTATLDVDAVLCTGDIVDGNGSVSRCCHLLQQHDVVCVRGNHDRWLFTDVLRDRPHATQLHQLTRSERALVRHLPATRSIAIPGGSMLLCHGVGGYDLERVTRFETDYSLQTNRYLQEVIQQGHRLMVHGHTHERLVTRVGAFVVVNAGAIHLADRRGFVALDFVRNTLTWYSITQAECAPAGQMPIFDDAAASQKGPR